MAVPKRKMSRANTRTRRSTWKADLTELNTVKVAGREIRVMVKPEKVSDEQMTLLARDICKKIEADLDYPGQIKVNMIRESRAVDYAK